MTTKGGVDNPTISWGENAYAIGCRVVHSRNFKHTWRASPTAGCPRGIRDGGPTKGDCPRAGSRSVEIFDEARSLLRIRRGLLSQANGRNY